MWIRELQALPSYRDRPPKRSSGNASPALGKDVNSWGIKEEGKQELGSLGFQALDTELCA